MTNWFLSKITDYWDTQQNAIPILVERLRAVPEEQRQDTLNTLAQCIVRHTEVLTPQYLRNVAVCMIDDVYKTMNAPQVFDNFTLAYLEATAGTLGRVLTHRGFAVRYIVNNAFELTPEGLTDVLRGFPLFFRATGFVYVCPQAIGQKLLGSDDPKDLIAKLSQVRVEAEHVTEQLLAKVQEEGRHYVFLDAEDDDTLLRRAVGEDGEGVIRIVRSEAPVPGSKIEVLGSPPPAN